VSLEERICEWHELRLPTMYPGGVADDVRMAAKLAEETGEVCDAVIKIEEGRRTLDDLAGEIGDVLLCLSVLAGRHGWTLEELLRAKVDQHVVPFMMDRAAEVMERGAQ
jgi:NTP pyrophosphatase (non-canonical NTP hydrolase)